VKTLLRYLQEQFTLAIGRSFRELPEEVADMAPCNQEGFGHYQCNSALRLAKILKQSPRDVAAAIKEALDERVLERLSQIEIAGPGFINITLSPSFLSVEVEGVLRDPYLGAPRATVPQRVIVEFSSPNIAKELHVGHLRSTIIGDCLARLFEFLGEDVLRLNHVGDWGTQFGMLIAYMQEYEKGAFGEGQRIDLPQLMGWYRKAKELFDRDPQFKKEAQLEVVRLQSNEEGAKKIWKEICLISRRGFQEIYDLLDVEIEERGESFYNPFLKEVVEELERADLVVLSDGAKCVFLDGFINREGEPLPLMVQKSDGGYNYDTTDMAALRYRIFKDRADRIIIVTDSGQSLHFQLIFKAGEKVGWIKDHKPRLDHVPFGLVLGADGKKFKTRSGETEKLMDLLMEAIERARVVIRERIPDCPLEEGEVLAKTIGIGALKYADLSSHRTKDYTFSYDRMLRFEGNTAVFLLYAYVRIEGIKRKTQANMEQVLSSEKIALSHPSEIALGLHLRRFGEVLEEIARDLLPNRLTEYLYELAEKFNAFFRDCRVEGSQEEGSRLLLCETTARILKKGLHLLGLHTVERM
jgi:arginyl-tRNA synthetase